MLATMLRSNSRIHIALHIHCGVFSFFPSVIQGVTALNSSPGLSAGDKHDLGYTHLRGGPVTTHWSRIPHFTLLIII